MTTNAPSTDMRIEALRLATRLAPEYEVEVLDLATRFANFLAGNIATLTPVIRAVEHNPKPDKVNVYAQIMTIVHESGIFVDPEQLAANLGRVITEAKVADE